MSGEVDRSSLPILDAPIALLLFIHRVERRIDGAHRILKKLWAWRYTSVAFFSLRMRLKRFWKRLQEEDGFLEKYVSLWTTDVRFLATDLCVS